MLRYILLKLPGFTSKTDYSISSKSNKLRLLRPVSPIKREARSSIKRNEDPRLYHRRSYSFPTCKPKSKSFLDRRQQLYGTWTRTDLQEVDGEDVIQKKGTHQKGRKSTKKIPNTPLCREHSTTQSKKIRADKFVTKNKEIDKIEEDQSYGIIDQYELEAARPRRSQSELLFNVFDYIPNDPTRYLQPNKQRPFGSTDNTYLPLLMESRPTNLTQFNTQNLQNPHHPRNLEKNVSPSNEKLLIKTKEHAAPTTDYYYQKKRKEYSSKELATYNELIQKHKELNPSYVSKKLSPKVNEQTLIDDAIEVADKYKTKLSNPKGSNKSIKKSLDESSSGIAITENKNNVFESYRLRWNEPGIKIEPPPFLNSTDICPSIGLEYSEKASKPINDYKCLQVPWPAYSDLVKENLEKSLLNEPIETENASRTDISDQQDKIQTNTIQKHIPKTKPMQMERENPYSSAKKVLRNKSIDTVHEAPIRNESNTSKSSVFVTKAPNKQTVSTSPLSLSNRKMYTSSSRTYAVPSTPERKSRAFEPPSCAKEEEPKKCFLPSKVRLSPPRCLAKPHFKDCTPVDPCPPRADQCYRVLPKKLPVLEVNKCPCVEPHVPVTNPKVRRLKFQFLDPPRDCPCKICPCPPRADDSMKEKKKKLPQYKPGNCECVEPPPMQDVPLVRLKKLCVPEEKCYPKPECPKPEPCERADDCRKDLAKTLPVLQSGNCPCVEPFVPDKNPKMQRLKMVFKDPERVCPCNPCPCPPRADDSLKQKIKKLPIYKPGFCECVEPPKMVDIPLKRLVKVCPPEVCDPPRECPVEICDVTARADFCLKDKPKKLPILKATKCTCVEPYVPNKNPKIKRLKMELKDKPRPSCEPPPCPPRADDTLKPKVKRLPVYVPGNCECVERPPMIDVPLVKLKKICEPEEKCYPPEECPKEELCKDKPRADDNLCVRAKTLPQLKPKFCPCVEPPQMTDVPKLKRLNLRVQDPEKYCPKSSCADYPRADDNLKEKNRKLPLLKAGDCPCIEHPLVDVKPLPRLKKCDGEEEPCVCEDPCIPFPRADWGCWEYTQDVSEKVNKCNKSAIKNKKVSVNTKRRYNTDSKVNLCSKTKPENKKKNETGKLSVNKILDTNSFRDELKLKPLNVNKLMNKGLKEESKSGINFKLSEPEGPSEIFDSCRKSCVGKDTKQNVTPNSRVICQFKPHKSKSEPTLKFLKKLGDLEKNSSDVNIRQDKNVDLRAILSKLSIHPNLDKQVLNTNIRKLSTDVIRQENSTRPISTGNVDCAPSKDCKKKKKSGAKKSKKCKLDKCDKVVLQNCPQKTQMDCSKERTPVCCEKKPSPFPAFSECMDEEVEPFTKKVTQWTCNNRQYGFEPKHKKSDDGLKNRKHFSTTSDNNYQHPNARKMTIIQDGRRTLQFNSSHILCPRRTRSISRTNFSTTSNNICIKDVSYQFPRYESSFQSKKCKRKKDCKKRKCPKFTLANCPPRERETCKVGHKSGCKKKRCSPYPAFSDCMDDELAEGINECPLERDKIELLQPKRPMDKPKLVDPIVPSQGLIDPRIEEDCLRAKHCLKQEGISQCCAEFGKAVKPLKSRDFPRPRDKDCDRIEELKSLGRWPPRNSKSFCTCTNSNVTLHRREYSTSGRTISVTCILRQNKEDNSKINNSAQIHTNKAENLYGTYGQEYDNTQLSKLYVRNYHILCNNAKRNVVEDVDKKTKDIPLNQFTDIDEPCKYMKLRNVQWRINNFQKWRRLNKLSALTHHVKGYHTCSKLKYRSFIKYSPLTKKFSTSQCKNISEFSDLYVLRGISTTIILARRRSNNFGKRAKDPFNPKQCNVNKDCPKFKLPNCPPRERFICKRKRVHTPCEKVVTPYPAFSECHDEEIRNTIMECPLGKERIQRLQPQYPLVPEIETVNLPPPYRGGIDPELEIDYERYKLGVANENDTQDCESFVQPIKYLKCNNIAGFSTSYSKPPPKKKCITKKKAARENYKKRGRLPEVRSCPPCYPPAKQICEADDPPCFPLPKQDCKADDSPCCPPKQVCELTLWQRIVNYFKARPNCPAPDEWKKRALREKAEKAAKAAGLCLVDPKAPKEVVQKNECKEEDDLPKVITPQGSDSCEHEQKPSNELCPSRGSYNKKNTADSCRSSDRRQFCTLSKRHYSQNVNWKYFEEFNKLVEEEKNKGPVEESFTSVMDKSNSLNETACSKDDDLRSPDPYCLKVFNEAILNKEKLNDITKYVDIDIKDEPINYSLEILTKNREFMDIVFNEPVDEFTNFSQAKAIAAFQEYVNKMDALTEISYEDIENSKTNNLIKELNKLLANKEE